EPGGILEVVVVAVDRRELGVRRVIEEVAKREADLDAARRIRSDGREHDEHGEHGATASDDPANQALREHVSAPPRAGAPPRPRAVQRAPDRSPTAARETGAPRIARRAGGAPPRTSGRARSSPRRIASCRARNATRPCRRGTTAASSTSRARLG